MSQLIPTSTVLTDYRQTTTLDGRDYILRFLFNQREGLWFFSMFDEEEDPIVEGLKVVVEHSLLRLITDPRKPPGLLVASDDTAREPEEGQKILALDPGLGELGERVVLLYFTEAELAAEGV